MAAVLEVRKNARRESVEGFMGSIVGRTVSADSYGFEAKGMFLP